MRIAAQTFTLRREMAVDPGEALARLRASGYDAVELAGLAGRGASEVAGALRASGVSAIALHASFAALKQDVDAVADDSLTLGLTHVVVPSLGDDQHSWGQAQYRRAAAELDRLGAELQERGLRLHVHNHATELALVEGARPLETLIEGTGEHVGFELDFGWVRVAGQDPLPLVQRLAGRLTLVHLKDVAFDGGSHRFRPLGGGVIDWPSILSACRAAGVEWGIVEDDDAIEGPYASLELSMAYADSILASAD